MHCAQARNLIALLVGDDLDGSDRPEVERHLSQCSGCQSYHNGLTKTHQELQSISSVDADTSSPSLWEQMRPAVRLANAERGNRRFNGWVAGLAIAATVMAMFAISGDFGPVRYQNQSSDSPVPPTMIGWPSQDNQDTRSIMIEEDQADTDKQQFDFR